MELNGIKIGDRFNKPLSKGKANLCEVVDFVKRESLTTGAIIEYEVWAKSVNGNYFQGKSFQTAFTTVKRFKQNNT